MKEKELSESLVFLAPPFSKSNGVDRNKPRPVNIALIHPHALMRESFSDLLKTNTLDFSVYTFTNVEHFLKKTMCVEIEGSPSASLKKQQTDDYDKLNSYNKCIASVCNS